MGDVVDGSTELLQLAHLLRVGADTARKIANVRNRDVERIHELAKQAEAMADEVEAIVRGANPDHSLLMMPRA